MYVNQNSFLREKMQDERKNMYFDERLRNIFIWACLRHKALFKLKSFTDENTNLGIVGRNSFIVWIFEFLNPNRTFYTFLYLLICISKKNLCVRKKRYLSLGGGVGQKIADM